MKGRNSSSSLYSFDRNKWVRRVFDLASRKKKEQRSFCKTFVAKRDWSTIVKIDRHKEGLKIEKGDRKNLVQI